MTASQSIDDYIRGIDDWRGQLLGQLRALINASDQSLVEEFKWGVPVWTSNGMVCAISAFKGHVKMNFFKGAQLPDPAGLINNGFGSKGHRAVDFVEDSRLNESALRDLVLAAVSPNQK